MSKKNQEERAPYYINMDIALDGLASVPKETTSAEIFLNVIVGAIVAVGKKKNGFPLADHSMLYKMRNDLDSAIKTKETNHAKLDYETFKFLIRNWNENTPDPQSNELIMRVWEKLKEAQAQHDRDESVAA